MTDESEIGSVGEEAMKLFGALADAARHQAGEATGSAGGFAAQAAAMAREVNEHLATGEAECRYCPVCRVVHAVRQTSPEVRTHLMVAASSLLQAAAGLMETLPPAPGSDSANPRGAEVEHIDLDEADDGTDDTPGSAP
ncbi:MAG: hypothetical protein NTX33_14680 [Propionibacteriales bacterium]|nr:hypothetical protein [Propionibacteriales bacterium]